MCLAGFRRYCSGHIINQPSAFILFTIFYDQLRDGDLARTLASNLADNFNLDLVVYTFNSGLQLNYKI